MNKPDVDRLIDEVGLPQAGKQRGVAAILFTYRCSIHCAHCCFACAGERPNVAMTPRQCADGLALLHETGRVIHIAGGEAMLYWDALAEAVRLANAEGNAPHFIETNCSFAADDAVVRERFALLATHGVKGILASADPFHQAFVPPAHFLRVRRIAREIFGEKNFWGSGAGDLEIEDLAAIARDPERLRQHVRAHPPTMVGAAQANLARHLDSFPPDDSRLPAKSWRGPKAGPGCAAEFKAETMWEIHLDPYGNLQTNCGVILGKVAQVSPAELLAAGPEKAHRFVQVLGERGPRGLAELAAREYGYRLPERVTQECELCYLTRRFLRRFHPDIFGPAEIYA